MFTKRQSMQVTESWYVYGGHGLCAVALYLKETFIIFQYLLKHGVFQPFL